MKTLRLGFHDFAPSGSEALYPAEIAKIQDMPQPGVFAFIQSEFKIGILRISWYFANLTSKNFIWRRMIWAVVIRLDAGVVGANRSFRLSVPVQERDKLIAIGHPPEAVRGIHNGDFFGTPLDFYSALIRLCHQ